MSPLADPNNPEGTYFYAPRVMRDWYDDAIEKERANWKDDYSTARRFDAFRVDR